ncbi:glycoside hydrolase family 44 protein [Runella slithyformis]|uniref:Alpha-L-arabinofuranosidase domain protein n=1 Tax=Runella slithyformis (strain ATCC 29530 / DSM 19594 / LMG 11500 / NCIMB 11436 / LSU 4) TaxID=761193 RepID=A0A7U3ZIL7_RUNSL|nr:glycoside hydrolase family 44 protein [Runella slithyformis]AEI47830.1 alpha-L-arabinofuranosidase domain protein [Runella slithyformis DSM 19594]
MKAVFLFFITTLTASSQVIISIDPTASRRAISPYLYGRNNSFSSTNPNWTLPDKELIQLRDAGVTFFRESTGNNCTKYNWRRKLSSHPDWYNNVYTNDWDKTALTLQKNFPNAQGMWAFQLIGKVAKTNQANFNDWGYNQSKWWEGVNQNLAGGGVLNPTGTKAKVEGNPDLYLENWPADSTVALMHHWFGSNGLGLNKAKIQYWNMDNEPEIWGGTHDDVMPAQLPAEDFMLRYFTVARKARAIYPAIKLVGPVVANEWQWYNWNNKPISADGRNYPWLEFFIKRIAEEQRASGIRLLDVLDIHFYPETTVSEEIVQLHRVFFDRSYVYPKANGVKNVNGSWDTSQNKEYILARVNDWLDKYLGANHGVTLGVTELGIQGTDPNVTAVWYASTMGEFMKNGVEIFTPWSWKTGMWEALHLFSRYNQTISVKGASSQETLVSAYPSINAAQDSMTVVLVNRSTNDAQNAVINFTNFILAGNESKTLTLKSLPTAETFISHTQNAISESKTAILNNNVSITLAPLSVTSIQLTGKVGQAPIVLSTLPLTEPSVMLYPNPATETITIQWTNADFEILEMINVSGEVIHQQTLQPLTFQTNITQALPAGNYIVRLRGKTQTVSRKIVLK